MSNLLFYRDFYGSVVYNSEEDTLQGKIEGIEDLITYEERSLSKIKIEFKNYVDGYIETCESVGKHHGKSNLAEAIMCESCKPMYRFIDNFIKKFEGVLPDDNGNYTISVKAESLKRVLEAFKSIF